MWSLHFAGCAVAFLGTLLLALNLADGLRKLSRRKHPGLLRAFALTQVILYWRAGP